MSWQTMTVVPFSFSSHHVHHTFTHSPVEAVVRLVRMMVGGASDDGGQGEQLPRAAVQR